MAHKHLRERRAPLASYPEANPQYRILRSFWLPATLLLAVAAGGLTGIVIAYELNYSRAASEVAALATYRPSVVTRIYADDGQTVIGEFALERRIPLKYDEIPPVVKNAILAVEDTRFYNHIGIDPIRILGAGLKNLRTGRREGGSTLTQQLTKNLFLSREQTFQRKFNEWMLALQIERFYTKNQIMEMYVNHMFMGARSYGFAAAAETYFGKQIKDVTLEEAALLAGIPKAPSQLSPTVNMQAAKERRNLVLDLMASNGYISEAEAEAAKAKPIVLADSAFNPSRSTPFDYPVEEIRQYLEDKYTTRVAQGGLSVYSTINVAAQKKAYEAVRAGLRNYDRTHSGWRSDYANIASESNGGVPTPQQLANYKHPDWFSNEYEPNMYIKGLVMSVDKARNEATVRFGTYTAVVTAKEMGRSKRQPRDEFKPGDLPEFRIVEVDRHKRQLKVELSQVPAIQGALISLNAKTGEVIAMVGGYDFQTNKFNNATQAYRQTGSCFKPFIYTAAVEWGLTPDSIVSGAPIKRGNWQPHNYDGSLGNADVPLKTALAKSLNIPAVHLLDMVGIQTGAQMVRRFGITVPMAPYLPSALGATEVPLWEMVSAYSVFPNKGVRVAPHLIRRVLKDGDVLEEWERETYKVTSEYVALTMVQMMRGVVENGTAMAAKSLGVPVAGKTGTVNDHTDVWFIGYTPTYVTGVWMGYPGRKKPLGADMTGGHGALPIFLDFMKDWLKDKPKEDFPKPPPMPEDIKELMRQRQREMAAERAAQAELLNTELPSLNPDTKLEQLTLPPAAGETRDPATLTQPPVSTQPAQPTPAPPRRPEITVPRITEPPDAPPARDRAPISEPPKKKGKKGTEGADGTP
jgi:penicillin-binding protein 1A